MAKDYGELLAAAKNGNKLTPYERLQMSTYKDSRTASTANTNDGGYIDSALRAAKSTGLGMLGGLSYLVGAEDTAKQLQQAAQENARRKEFDTVFDWNYITDPEGALYDVAGGLTSMAMLAPAAFLLPESAAAGAAGVISSGLGRAGLGRLGTWAASEAGKKALQTGVRGAMTAIPESVSEWGNTAQEAAEMGIENPRASTVSDFAKNMAMLPMSNALEYMLLGGKVFNKTGKAGESLAKRIAYAPFRATPPTAANAGQNAIEEFFQQSFSDEALGKPTGSLFDPSSWTPEQRQALQAGGVVGGVLGGVGAGKRALFDTTKPSNQEQPQVEQEEAGDSTTSPDNPLPPNTEVSSIQRMRELQGKIPYEAEDGTNCMRTLGIALAGTPYGGQINVDQAIETAKKQGQLMEPDKYIPRPGDIAVVEDGNHAVMVTENGGTIQNGASHNGVYESDQSPLEMFGKVKYYIRTSDYANGPINSRINGILDAIPEIASDADYVDEALQATTEPLRNLNSLASGQGFEADLMSKAEAEDDALANEINSANKPNKEVKPKDPLVRAGEIFNAADASDNTKGQYQAYMDEIVKAMYDEYNPATLQKASQKDILGKKGKGAVKGNKAANFAFEQQQEPRLQQANSPLFAAKKVSDFNKAAQIALASRGIDNKNTFDGTPNFILGEQQTEQDQINQIIDSMIAENDATQGQPKYRDAQTSAITPTQNQQQGQYNPNSQVNTQYGRDQQMLDLENRLIEQYKGNPEAFNRQYRQAVEAIQQAAANGSITQDIAREYVKNLSNMYNNVIGPINNNGVILRGGKPKPAELNERPIRKLLRKMRSKPRNGLHSPLLSQNMPAERKKMSMNTRIEMGKYRERKTAEQLEKEYQEIKQEVTSGIVGYPTIEDKLKAIDVIREEATNSLHDLLQPTVDKLKQGMGNGVTVQYVDKETNKVADVSGMKGAEELKNGSASYNREWYSNNAKWYQEWYKLHGKPPTKAELYDIAEEYYTGNEQTYDATVSWNDGTAEAEAEKPKCEANVRFYHNYLRACDEVEQEVKNGTFQQEQQTAESTQGTKTQEEQNTQADKNLITPQDIDALVQKPASNTLDGIIEEMAQQQPKPKAEPKAEQGVANEGRETSQDTSTKTEQHKNPNLKPVEKEKDSAIQTTKAGAVSKIDDFKHTKTGEMIPAAKLDKQLEANEFADARRIAKEHGGDWNGFASKALKERGVFLFAKGGAEGRDEFIKTVNDKYGATVQQAKEESRNAAPLTNPKGEQFKQIESYFKLWTNAFKNKAKGKVFMYEVSATISHIENLANKAAEDLTNNNIDEFEANMSVAANMIRDLKRRYEEKYRSEQPLNVAESKHLEMVNSLMDSWAKDYEAQIAKAKEKTTKAATSTFKDNPESLINEDALNNMSLSQLKAINDMFDSEKKEPATKGQQQRFDGERAKKALDSLIGKKKKKAEPQQNDIIPKLVNIFNEDELDEEIAKAKAEMSKLSANPMFNPALMKSLFKIGGIYLQKGINRFASWAQNMVDTLGETARPFLPAVWDSLKKYPQGQKFNDDVMTAVMEYVGDGVDQGKTLSAIKREFADDYGEEYLGYVDAAYEGVKKYPTEDTQSVVKSNIDDTAKGGENNGVHGQTVYSGRTEGSGATGSGVPGVEQTVRSGQVGDRKTDSVLGEKQAQNGGKTEKVGDNERVRVHEDKPSGRPLGGEPERRNVYNGSERGRSENKTDVAGGDGRRVPGTVGGRSEVTTNYHIDDPDALIGGTPMVRFLRNKKAVEVVQELMDNDRPATKEERDAMAAYTGWGSFGQELFKGTWEKPVYKEGWKEENDWLRETLGKEAWIEAQNSIINAHYTDPYTISSMWNMAKQMGFKGGKVLEPSMGVGNFFGLMPKDIAEKSQLTGIELDRTTGRMAQALYPQANIQIKGYQDSLAPDNFYDLIIGNVPFGNFSIADRKYGKLKPLIHDFFFLKGIDQLKPGGLMMAITSKGSLDKADARVRMELAQKADLVAAFRLPTGAFDKYAGTNVVTDILIFKKLENPRMGVNDIAWVKSSKYETRFKGNNETYYYNDYYKENPENVLGVMEFGHGTTTGRPGLTVRRLDNFGEKLKELSKRVPKNIFSANETKDNVKYISNHQGGEQGSVVIGKDDNKLYTVYGEQLKPLQDSKSYIVKDEKKTAKREQEFRDWLELRDILGQLYDAEKNDAPNIEELRSRLNTVFDEYCKSYVEKLPAKSVKEGQPAFRQSFANKYMKAIDEPSSARLMALVDDKGRKAAIFSKRSVRGSNVNIKNPTIAQALIMQRNENVSNLDIDRIAQLSKKNKDEVISELTKSGTIFKTPAGNYEVKDVYLAGNVRQKLREAEDALQNGDKDMQVNIEALKKVIPATVPYYNISTSLGATWIPQNIYKDFVAYLLGVNGTDEINIVKTKGFTVEFSNKQYNHLSNATTVYGIDNIAFNKLLTHAFNHTKPLITTRDANRNVVEDTKAMEAANDKLEKIYDAFNDWLWKDNSRKMQLENEYNEIMNAIAVPTYDGSFMDMPGMALLRGDSQFSLRKHQLNAIYRGLINGSGVYAHEVGTGKTYTMAGLAVESRRYGLAKKPLLLAFNANSASVAKEINDMYPGAKVLYIDNMDRDNIQLKLNQIRTDDWDCIVMPHSLVDKLSFQEETLMNMAEKQIYALEQAAIEAAALDGEKLSVEQMETLRTAGKDEKIKIVRNQTAKKLVTMRNQIINQIKQNALNASSEDAIPFEELGIDMVLVDEAHAFKKPPFTTTRKIKGLTTESSDRAIQLSFITQYIQSINNGRGIHLFTGTPITNTLTEMYHMMRYVMPKAMEDANILEFDSWMNSFAEETADMEFTSTGDVEMVSRLASFTNVPELRRFVGQYWDTVFADDMPEFSPRKTASGKTITDKLTEKENDELLNGYTENPQGRPYKKVIIETLKLTSAQNTILKDLVAKAKQYKEASKQEKKQIAKSVFHGTPLLIGNDASLAGMDPRLYDLNINTEGEETKIDRCVSNVVKIYNEGTATAPTVQVIFTDVGYKDTKKRSIPVQTGLNEWKSVQETVPTFNMSKAIVQELVKNGIPENEIIIMKSSYSAEKRAEIADMLKVGKYRVVIGSTATLGVGVNMQDNLRAMHHLDCPWMPGDLVQRNGRGHRQGNHWNTVLEYRYVTEKLDTKRWQTVLRKDAFINSFMKSKVGDNAIRSFEMGADDLNDKDTDSDLLQTLSDASGDPRVLIQKKYEINLAKLKRKERTFVAGIEDVKAKLGAIDNTISNRKATWDNLAADAKTFAENKKDTFSIKLVSSLKPGQSRNLVTFESRAEAQKHLEELLKQVANIGTDNHIGEYAGFSLEVRKEQSTVDGTYVPVIRINGQGEYACGTPTINGITANAGNIPGKVSKAQESYQQAVNDKAILQKAVKETFPQQELLDKTSRQLEEIKQDRLLSPTPPPAWLTDGVTLSSTFYVNGDPYSLVGYRANSDGYYLVGEYNGKQVVFPFQDATDIQGMPIYDMTNHVPSPAYKPPEIPKESMNQKNTQYSTAKTTQEAIRPRAEIEAEIRTAFPNGTITYENGVPVVTLPNGAKFQYSIRKNIIVNAREQKKADSAHGTSSGVIQGFWQKFSGNGVQRLLAVAQNSERGTTFHEAMHAAIDLALTEKEANALRKYYQNKAKEQNRNVDEVIADAYRDWVLARQQKRGTVFGKLWQKIKDFCVRIRSLFDNGAEVQRIMQDVESGKVYERGANNSNIKKRVYFSKVEIQGQAGSGTTQRPNTRTMYVAALRWLRNELPSAKTVLDYGAGLGLGTEDMRANNPDMDIECYEPNPQRWRGTKPPTYTSNTQINRNYDLILNTNVLNVVEKPIRDLIVKDIASHLNMGGKALITTRSWNVIVKETKNYTLADEYHAVWVNGGKNGPVYQKGFDPKELKEYLEDILGKDFTVERTKPTFSNVSVVVTKVKSKTNTNNAQNVEASQEMPDSYKTLKGSPIKRSKYGVGKLIGGQIYLHKDYALDVIPKDVWEKALKVLADTNSDFEYNCVMYDAKTGNVRFDEAPDFDTAREPVVGNTLTVKPDGTTKAGYSKYIWHHKWIWVKNDYQGFDVNESKAWSQKWLGILTETADGNGIERWNTQLDRFGLEHDGENTQYSVAAPKSKIASAFTNTERKTRLETAKDFFKEHAKNLYSDMIDKNHILKSFDELTKSTGGLSVYEQAQGLPSTTAGMLKAITMGDALSIEKANLHLKNVKMKHKVTLAMVLDKINKKAMDEKHDGYLEQNGFDSWANAFGAYLGAKRLLEMGRIAKAQNEPYSYPKGLTENELTQFVGKAPKEFAQAADMFYKVNDNVISIMEDAQVFSPELAKVLRTKYRNYCPLLRDFSDTAAADSFFDGLTVGGRGIGNVSIPLKKISINGSERGVLNPLETTLKAYSVMLNRAERNKVGLLAVNRAKATGLKELIEEVPEVIGKDGKVVNAVADPKNCIFTVLVKGKKKAFKTTQELYTPIVGFNLPAANLCFEVARMAAHTLRTGATMSPSFIVRNFLRDTIFAGISSKNGFKPFVDSIRGAWALLKKPELKAEFEAAGVTEFNFFNSKNQRIKSIDQMTGEEIKDAWTMFKAIFDSLENASAFVESSTRMGEFMRARKNGLTIEEAARAAREVTLDFSRSGRVGEQINQFVPFFNACLQGGDKMYRLFREDPMGTSQKVFQYIVLPSIILMAMNWDKDWYKDLDPDIKSNYWCLSDKVRIPKPQEAGVLFGSGIEALITQAAGRDKEAMKNVTYAFLDNMLPNIVPTLFLPLLEWQSNYNYFKGRQIVGNKYKNLPDELQYSDYTSEAAKGIGSVMKVSPMKVDNLVRGYTGTMGAFLWSTPDFVTNKAKDAPTKNWYEYYPFRDFTVTDSNLSRPMNEFYDLLERANKQHAGYGKKGQPSTTTQAIRKVGTMLGNYRKEIDKITKSKGLAPDRKRELIDLRKKKMNELAKRTVEKYKDKV